MMKKCKKSLAFVLALALFMTSGAFFGVQAEAAKKTVKAKSVTLNYKTKSLKVGGKVQLKATVKPKKTKQKKVTWSTSNKKVATVTAKGLVKAKKAGTAKITAKVKGTKLKKVCKVTVKAAIAAIAAETVKVSEITLTPKSISVEKGKTQQINAKVTPESATDKSLAYASQNITIATVDSKGVVTGVTAGTTTVKVLAQDGSGVSAALNVTVTGVTATNPPATTKPVTKVEGIVATPGAISLASGNTCQINAIALPGTATVRDLSYVSGDVSVATVDNTGKVTGVGAGKTEITISAQDGSGISITIPVEVFTDTVVASAPEEVERALQSAVANRGVITTVKIATKDAAEFTIPAGDYRDLNLLIDAPNAEVKNYATFKKIAIDAIADSTYREYAVGNTLDVNAPISRIIITEEATADVNLNAASASTKVVANGIIESLNVKGTDSKVDISGTTQDNIPVKASASASINTSHILDVDATAKLTLTLYAGAENTIFTVDKEENCPAVYGLGTVEVRIEETGDVQTIVAEYRDDVSGDESVVTFTGTVLDMDTDKAVSGAAIELVPYTNSFDESTVETNPYVSRTWSDAKGVYTIDSIRTGNYIMLVKEEGMVPVLQYVLITSRYGSVFQNETLYLFAQTEANEPGNITGTLTDSLTGYNVADMRCVCVKERAIV